MGLISAASIDYLFSSTTTHSQAQLDSLANNILSQGIDFYQKGDYDRAINSFKRSAGLSPFSDNSAKAYNYIAQSYQKQDKTEEAIRTYREAIRIYPVRDEFRLALGDIYKNEGLAVEALAEYEAAVRFNPNSAQNRYALGLSCLDAGRLTAAREQFQAVAKLSPNGASGYYGLGQVARASGDYQDAISQLTRAIGVDRNFENSYLELGYTYADMGDMQRASEQWYMLSSKGSSSAATLENYMSQVSQPQIMFALGLDGFNNHLGPKTKLATMDADLAAPGSAKLYSINFVFSKDMDISSVQNRNNWGITRASIAQNGGVYNGGLTVPDTEAMIRSTPASVTYDDEENTAVVRFRISQNTAGNATLDPAHIVFKFYGQDAYGKAMDASADEYSGFSGVA
jgi:tetratricopeptide (TPR) repeat protein